MISDSDSDSDSDSLSSSQDLLRIENDKSKITDNSVENNSDCRKIGSRRKKRPRTVFDKAMDALNMTWEDNQLKLVLTSDIKPQGDEQGVVNHLGQLLWNG